MDVFHIFRRKQHESDSKYMFHKSSDRRGDELKQISLELQNIKSSAFAHYMLTDNGLHFKTGNCLLKASSLLSHDKMSQLNETVSVYCVLGNSCHATRKENTQLKYITARKRR